MKQKVMFPNDVKGDMKKGKKFGLSLIPNFFNILLFLVLLSSVTKLSGWVDNVAKDEPTGILMAVIKFIGDAYMFTVFLLLVFLFIVIYMRKDVKLVD